MSKTAIAGNNYTIASCGHPLRPGEHFVEFGNPSEMYCSHCWSDALQVNRLPLEAPIPDRVTFLDSVQTQDPRLRIEQQRSPGATA